ncbi:MAG: carbohydrate ABC transporter permease [Chloroflexi bacterium]|nr:carbohydrate ABC transporter permease [Chloroflexota bacterium]
MADSVFVIRQRQGVLGAITSRKWWEKFFLRIATYIILINVCFVFLFPVIYMFSTSLKTVADLADLTVLWIPRTIFWRNYELAISGMLYWQAARNSIIISLGSGILQTVACSFVAYGFARIPFPGRDVLFLLVLFTFLVPPQTIIVPLFILYRNLGFMDTYFPFLIPALFGHGLRGALFILVFRQFFRNLPYELEDAARIDGAGPFSVYWRIMLPLATPAIIVVFLFSLVWHWNDFFEPTIYLFDQNNFTLPLRLSILSAALLQMLAGQGAGDEFNEAVIMAASFLVVMPPLIVYLFTQRYFVESVDRTGLVE